MQFILRKGNAADPFLRKIKLNYGSDILSVPLMCPNFEY
jgi:hypothetical protein